MKSKPAKPIFDPLKALKPLNGKTFNNLKELNEELRKVIWKNRHLVPADFGVRQLRALIEKNHWYRNERKTR